MRIVIALDIGTSTISAVALHAENGSLLAVRSTENDAEITGLPCGYHEQNPVRILDICSDLLADLLSGPPVNASTVERIGISGQMHGVMLVEQSLQARTNLITWRDGRTLVPNQLGNLDGALNDLGHKYARDVVTQRVGCKLHAGYGGATLHWLAKNNQLVEDCLALSIADFVAASFTGIASTEQTHAASWGILDLKKSDWDSESIDRLGIPKSVLPSVRSSCLPLGTLQHSVAQLPGLHEGVQVCSPLGDNQASFIGATGMASDTLVFNLGTGGQISIPTKDFAILPRMETRPMPFGGFLLVGASLCGGWSYSYLRQFYQQVLRDFAGVEISDAQTYKQMNSIAKSASEGAEGLDVDTRFNGTRDTPSIRGTISNIGTDNLTPGNLTRAFVEGMVGELAEMARDIDMQGVKEIIGGGNAVRMNPLVLAAAEKAFGLPCRIAETSEDAATGAALAVAHGLSMSDSK